MKTLTITLFFILSLQAKADVFNCTFTDPDISLKYNTATETLTETSWKNKVSTFKGVTFEIKNAGTFLVKNKRLSLELKLNNEGSDGASDNVYPYEAKLSKKDEVIFGGCTSMLKSLVKNVD